MSFITGQLVHDSLQKAGVDPVQTDAVLRFLSDHFKASPLDGPRPTSGWLYDNGPFTLIDDDPISAVIPGDSPLGRWLPSRRITDRFETVSHLEWVAPQGFDGSQTYAEYLAGVQIDDCGFGPSTSWSGFQYQMQGGKFSWTTSKMKVYPDGGVKYHDKQPLYTLRGSSIGQPLSSDKEWAVARVLIAMAQHLDYVLKFGNVSNSVMEWDGLSQILTPGYVQARIFGPGIAHWADPLVVNGAPITTPGALAQAIRVTVRRLRRRLRDRNWMTGPGDMAVFMSSTMWDNLAEFVASGAFYRYSNAFGFDGEMTFRDFRQEYRDAKTGGLGFGTLEIDGEPVPVIADGTLGMNVTLDPDGTPKPAVAGDIYVLTRRANGMALLEQQYVNWDVLDYPTGDPETTFTVQNGLVRAGWITENNTCFYYYGEMGGRVVSYMQPLQGVIRNVVLETLDSNENESGAFYSPDFYAYNGNRGGQGTGYLFPA
ncbi:hypothetical protein Rctr85_013 [Virus Rctr85]|nr:hypothetical protein Rctr85_013 [Virus Rctr85]